MKATISWGLMLMYAMEDILMELITDMQLQSSFHTLLAVGVLAQHQPLFVQAQLIKGVLQMEELVETQISIMISY